ncbi:MAG: glycosyltransferase family 4 protein [Myxococcota bacterium]
MGRLLIVSQVYPPDATAVGQYLADLAEHLVTVGKPVSVVSSDAGYDDPSVRYPRSEIRNGVEIFRVPASSFGKRSIGHRLAGSVSFLAQAIAHGARLQDVDHVLVSTSPPIAALAALTLRGGRRLPWSYWVMDLNPEQAVAMGHFSETHPAVLAFDLFNRAALRSARNVITLDRYMADRLRGKFARAIEVIPPWPLDRHVQPVEHEDNGFRREQGWNEKLVIMFSGNMSPTSPIDTAVDAAARLRDRSDVVFAFIGGGKGREELERRLEREPLPNVRVLDYQPLEHLRYSLSAADAHIVTMGKAMVGITHPCKVYSALAVARPLIAIAPEESHIGALVSAGAGWRVEHGDVAGFVTAVDELSRLSPENRRQLGSRNVELLRKELDPGMLRTRMADLIST